MTANKKYQTGSREVTLVNPNGSVIGPADIFQAHHHPAQLHLATSVYLFNDQGQLLIQKRSAGKIVGANWWANTVCGNVKPTESVEACAFRRLREELGIEQKNILAWQQAYSFEYQAFCNAEFGEHELDTIFLGRYNDKPQPNPDEVAEYLWVNWTDLLEKLHQQQPNYVSAQSSLAKPTNELKQITIPITIEHHSEQLIFCPWTLIMLYDERLKTAVTKFLQS